MHPASFLLLFLYLSPWAETHASHWPIETWSPGLRTDDLVQTWHCWESQNKDRDWVVIGIWIVDSGCLGVNPQPASYQLCDLDWTHDLISLRLSLFIYKMGKITLVPPHRAEVVNICLFHSKFYRSICCLLFIEMVGITLCGCTKQRSHYYY